MCSILGFISCGSRSLLQECNNTMVHRGPDDNGIQWFNEKNSGLAHNRLSIIDLRETASQPMFSNDGRYWIVYNGELYNYIIIKRELISKGYNFRTQSDTEVLLYSFVEWGYSCLEKFNGMFAFAIYDIKVEKLFIARDRIGIKPLYYVHFGNSLIFASEIKAILKSELIKKEVDYRAIHTPIHFQISPYTGFKNIFKLLPGHFLTFKNGNISIKKYWSIDPSENSLIKEEEAFDKLDHLLNESVKLQMISDVPIGLLLSGGLDSSIIAALMQKYSNRRINSFTIKFSASDLKKQGNIDDSYFAKLVADKFNFNHREILIDPNIIDLLPKIIWHLDEPISDPSSINTYIISKAAKDEGISVLLNGMGGDEIFGGYRSYQACLYADHINKFIPRIVQSTLKKSFDKIPQSTKSRNLKYIRWAKEFLNYSYLPQDERYMSSGNVALTGYNFSDYYLSQNYKYKNSPYYQMQREYFADNELSYLTKMCLNDTRIYLPDHNLAYSDKSSMAASIEARPPLTDHRIVEFMFSLPPEYRIRQRIQKFILKKVSENYLPRSIIYRPKAPFSAPMRSWLKGPLKEMVADLLSESSLKNRGVYNYQFVNRLIKNNDSGLQDNSQLIFRLLSNELWFRTFIDK